MYCSHCGAKLHIGDNFCFKCGETIHSSKVNNAQIEMTAKLDRRSHTVVSEDEPVSAGSFNYAGFWKRMVATIIDLMIWILFIITIVLFLPIDDELYELIGLFIAWMYYGLLDSSTWQGTIGKKVMRIAVCDSGGERISFFRASMRYVLHLVSNITLLIGYLMVMFTAKKQALHDMICGTMVINKEL